MVMERLEAARKHPDNQSNLKQFAIGQARKMLRSAGVIDPGPKEQKDITHLHFTHDSEPSDQEKEDFKNAARTAISQLPGDLPVGSLIYWNTYKRKHDIEYRQQSTLESLRKSAEQLKQLPEAPLGWVEFCTAVSGSERGTLTRMLGFIARINEKRYLTRIDEVEESLIRYRNPEQWQKTDRLVHHVFQGL